MSGGSRGLVFWAPGMVSAMDMTVVLLCSAARLKGVPEVKVMVLGSQGSSRKALSLNLQCPGAFSGYNYAVLLSGRCLATPVAQQSSALTA